MPAPQPPAQVVVVDASSPEMHISSWPLADAPLPVWPILGLAVAGSIGAGFAAGSVWFAVVSLLAMAAALHRLWLPVEFHLSELGVSQKMLTRRWRIPWREFAVYQVRQSGILLMPDEDDTPIGTLKGLYIPWGNRKEELTTLVEHYVVGDLHTGSTALAASTPSPSLEGAEPETTIRMPIEQDVDQAEKRG